MGTTPIELKFEHALFLYTYEKEFTLSSKDSFIWAPASVEFHSLFKLGFLYVKASEDLNFFLNYG